jgi:hypothetical protein
VQAGRGELAITLGDTLSLAWMGDAHAGFKRKLDALLRCDSPPVAPPTAPPDRAGVRPRG